MQNNFAEKIVVTVIRTILGTLAISEIRVSEKGEKSGLSALMNVYSVKMQHFSGFVYLYDLFYNTFNCCSSLFFHFISLLFFCACSFYALFFFGSVYFLIITLFTMQNWKKIK